MFLILSEIIYNSSIQVKYLNTKLSNVKQKAVLLIHLLINEDNNSYYKDFIKKYMKRITNIIFD